MCDTVKVRDFCHILDSKLMMFCIIVYLTVLSLPLDAQIFDDVYILESQGVSISTSHALRDGDVTYLYGQFFGSLDIGDFELEHVGSADLFLMRLVDGQPEWVFYGGSNGSDKAVDIELDDDGNIVIGGEFWLEAQFGDLTLVTEGSTKSLFVIKLDSDGNILSHQSINGSGAKNMNGLALIGDDVYVNGSFSDTLFLTATSAVANADQDIYVLKLDKADDDGWIQHYGVDGKSISVDFSWDAVNDQFIVSGEYLGQLAVAMDTIDINTFDQDMFVAAFDINGEGLWLQKAGGQFEDFNEAHCLDDEGNIYLTGFFRGIIGFSDGSQINTGGIGNLDGYIIKYSPDGEKIWARNLGDLSNTEAGTNISFENGRLYWTAYHEGAFNIDGIDFFNNESSINGLVAVFNTDGILEQGIPLPGNMTVIPMGIIPEEQNIFVFGDFQGKIELDQTYTSSAFSSFHVNIIDLISSSSDIISQNIKVYPNPVSHTLQIELDQQADHLAIFNQQGISMYQSPEDRLSHSIDFSRFESGIYFWRTASGARGKVIKK